MITMKTEFTTGSRVKFDSDHGPQKGTVIGITRDIANGESFALIEVDHVLPGCTWHVPLTKLAPEAARQ
jgi:hypothetical protein